MMSEPLVELKEVCAGYRGHDVLHDVSFALPRGSFTALIGPNGGGKTTLLRVACRILRPRSGEVLLAGQPAGALSQMQVGRLIGFVPQTTTASYEFTVEEAVLMGRYPHLPGLSRPGRHDLELTEQAMEATGVTRFRHRMLGELSGGELQRALLARSLAQQPEVLMLDEPTAHLDLAYQAEVLDLLRRLNADGLTILAVLHDLNLAAQFFGQFALLAAGQILVEGDGTVVLNPAALSQAYGAAIGVQRGAGGEVVRVYAEPQRAWHVAGLGREAAAQGRMAPAAADVEDVVRVNT